MFSTITNHGWQENTALEDNYGDSISSMYRKTYSDCILILAQYRQRHNGRDHCHLSLLILQY